MLASASAVRHLARSASRHTSRLGGVRCMGGIEAYDDYGKACFTGAVADEYLQKQGASGDLLKDPRGPRPIPTLLPPLSLTGAFLLGLFMSCCARLWYGDAFLWHIISFFLVSKNMLEEIRFDFADLGLVLFAPNYIPRISRMDMPRPSLHMYKVQ